MTTQRNYTPAAFPASQRGFTLIEIMVTLVLVGILLAGLVELFVSTKRNSIATDELSRIQETGRIAIQMLSTDVRRAGTFAGHVDEEKISGTLGASDPNHVNCEADSDKWGRKVVQAVAGIDDDHAAYACLADAKYLRGDVLTVRYASPWPVDPNTPGVLYFRTNVVEARIFDGSDASDPANKLYDDGVQDLALIARSYFVGASEYTCRGEAVPSLFRTSLDETGQPDNKELLPGVEHLQFRYLENTPAPDPNDPETSSWRDADTVANWLDVSAVEIAVLVRAECPEAGFVNDRDFTLGNLGIDAYGPNDGFRRQLFTTVTAIRSRGLENQYDFD